MYVVYPICCGIDIHKETAVCCLRTVDKDGNVNEQKRIFGTTATQLLLLLDWLLRYSCPVVGMESTGVYWKPIFNILHGSVKVIIGNAKDMKPRKGQKTDAKDASWISQLLAHGLIQPSFIPPPQIRGLRDLTRMRVSLIQMRTQSKNRILKILEDANIKLSNIVSDVFGKSGRLILNALVKGERKPSELAEMALGRIRKNIPQLKEALDGKFTEHHAMMITICLQQIELLDDQILQLDRELIKKLGVWQNDADRLITIPGVQQKSARVIIAEIGLDMSTFGSAKRLSSWAGISPGNNESAGKRRSGKISKGNKYLKQILVQCAWAAAKTDSFLGQTYRRLEARIGAKKAAVAVGHKILVIVYNILEKGTIYQEAMYDDIKVRKDKRAANKAITVFKRLGFKVNIDDDNKTISIMQKITETGPKKASLMPVQLALF